MRGFIITIILFILLLSIVILNFFYIDYIINNMKQNINSLQSIPCEENAITINKIKENWQKDSVWVGLSVSYEDIEELTDMIASLEAANAVKDYNQFKLYCELILNSIEDIGRLEKFSVNNIL